MADKPYAWRSWSFQVGDDLQDRTVLTLLRAPEGVVDLSVTITEEQISEDLGTFITGQVEDLAKTLSAYKLRKKSERKVAGQNAWLLEQEATDPEGKGLFQMQAYVPSKDAGVLIITATAGRQREAEVRAHLDTVVTSLKAEA